MPHKISNSGECKLWMAASMISTNWVCRGSLKEFQKGAWNRTAWAMEHSQRRWLHDSAVSEQSTQERIGDISIKKLGTKRKAICEGSPNETFDLRWDQRSPNAVLIFVRENNPSLLYHHGQSVVYTFVFRRTFANPLDSSQLFYSNLSFLICPLKTEIFNTNLI